MKNLMNILCPLCQATTFKEIQKDLLKCDKCHLVFKSKSLFLSEDEEKARYEFHRNDEDNPGYTDFLNRLRLPLLKYLKPGFKGLDYGCGPGPVLAELLRKDGFEIQIYDPFFAPEKPQGKFDFITCTEAIEHFHDPKKEIESMISLLNSSGILAFMTYTYDEKTDFDSWWYVKDPTHVCFFSERTFEWVASERRFQILVNMKNLFLARYLLE